MTTVKQNNKTNFEKVLEFHKIFNCQIDTLSNSTKEQHNLRINLLNEEFEEVKKEIINEKINDQNLIKELCDLLYVTYGYLVTLGYDADKCFALVHDSNLSKLDDEGNPIFREDGKILKSNNYKPVNNDDFLALKIGKSFDR